MNTIETIDLWTEVYTNQYECFNGAFIDGFDNNQIPFERYKIIKNCNCVIENSNDEINITNKHHAIVFYKNSIPVRLLVINKNTDVEKCIKNALNQSLRGTTLANIFVQNNIQEFVVDMKEIPIYNNSNPEEEIDVGSCDRWNLLYNMLRGSYTEDQTQYGNYTDCKYTFLPDLKISYSLKTDTEHFEIKHKCAFINEIKTRLIPLQENSRLTNNNGLK